MESIFKKRKGFAIILVAALAGLLFLLGASLVAISQLQRAASNYDQRTRLARDNAKAALEMAVGEMQRQLGPDKAITYQADLKRANTTESFKVASAEETSGVYQPFWMSAELTGGTLGADWLISNYPGVTADVYDPFSAEGEDWVTLVGGYSVYSSINDVQKRLEVRVPKEVVSTSKPPPGYTANRTIGHVAYWVDDLGTKASYALYDKTDFDLTTPYADADQRDRLRQLRGSNPSLETVETNDGAGGELADSNPKRIDEFVNDFQFRERFGGSEDKERYLKGLIEETPDSEPKREVSKFFHDYTPLSKGLLTDPVSGGYKRDLSRNVDTGDVEYDTDYLPYSRLASEDGGTAGLYDSHSYTMRAASASSPAIMPVLTQFNLNYSVYFENINEAKTEADLMLSVNSTCEFWNPYSSDLSGEELLLTVTGLPPLKIDWVFPTAPSLGLLQVPDCEFTIPGSVGDDSNWRPGQVATFSGPTIAALSGEAPFELGFGPDNTLIDNRSTFVLAHVIGTFTGNPTLKFVFDTSGEATPVVEIVPTSDAGGNPTRYTGLTYELNRSYTDLLEESNEGVARFGFSWEVKDGSLSRNSGYNPFNPTLKPEDMYGFEKLADDGVNLSLNFLDSESVLLGYNSLDFVNEDGSVFDVLYADLPKQEIVSVAGIGNTVGVGASGVGIGSVGDADNSFFDDSFFSTIPQGVGLEKPSVLPNSGYVPVEGATMEELQSEDAAEHLWVHGMFNVHSTSMDAWAAMLKSSPASRSNYWKDKFDGLAAEERYLFFNYPQSAENVWTGFDYDPEADGAPVPTDLDFIRQSMRQGVFALTGDQIDVLAKHIVSEIRKRYQGVGVYGGDSGPFASLQEFVDSGMLQNAIKEANDELKTSGVGLTKDWVVTGKGYAAEFRQSTILNLLAPYLSVRSDTFLVRAYGDAVNPAEPDEVWARAYCEAVVQRTHDWHDPSDETHKFGRKLKVVAFRWLAPSEI